MKVKQDSMGTHIDWHHEGITPKMIDWFGATWKRGLFFGILREHEPLTWVVPPKHGNL